jgi:outer membrane receptor protein involved in Fe transport
VLPSLPVAFRPSDEITLRASVARLVNRPKFDELSPFENDSAADKIVRGNPDLEPARAWAFEASVDYATKNLFLSVGLFHREIQGVIESLPTGEVVGTKIVEQMQNVGDGYVQGVTFEQRLDLAILDVSVLEGFSISANQTLTRSRLRTDEGIARPFKDQPEVFGNLGLEWSDAGLGTTISVGANYVGPIRQTQYGFDDREEELFLEAQVTQEIAGGVEVFLLGQNLTNENRVKLKANGEREVESAGVLFMLGLTAEF